MSSTEYRVTFVGAVNSDEIIHLTDVLHPGASNPVHWTRSIGGVACNASRAASRLIPTGFVGTIGADSAGSLIRQYFALSPVTASFHEVEKLETGRYGVVLDRQGELILGLATTEISEQLTLDHLQSMMDDQTQPDLLVIDTNLSSTCIRDICAQKPAPRLAALTVSPVKSMRLADHASEIDVLITNRAEASMLSGLPTSAEIIEISAELHKAGFHTHIITDGAAPLLVRELNTAAATVAIEATSIIANVNGAGDALAGATLAGWIQGNTLLNSVTSYGVPAALAVLSGELPAPALA